MTQTPKSPPKNNNNIIIAVSIIIVLIVAVFAGILLLNNSGNQNDNSDGSGTSDNSWNNDNSGANNYSNPTATPEPTPIPDFNIQLTGGTSGTVKQGNSIQTTLFVKWLSGNAESVSLSASSGSSGIQCSFNPSAKAPDYTSALTMKVPSYTSTNAYSITITATNGAVTRSTSYTVSVLSAEVYVSGTAEATGTGASITQIQFVDSQSSLTYTVTPSDGNYHISLENQHSYKVTVMWKGLVGNTGTYDGGTIYVNAPVGYTSQTENFSG